MSSSDILKIASDELEQLYKWWSALQAGKPKGYQLTVAEDSKRRTYLDTIRGAATDALDDAKQNVDIADAQWVLLQAAKFDAVTTAVPKEAVAAAQSAILYAKSLKERKPDEQTAAELAMVPERAAFILANNGKRPALTWADSLNCGAADFWGPCNAGNNWLLWIVGAAVVVWYGRKKKWF